MTCFQCGEKFPAALLEMPRIGFREECSKCRADVRVCRNCTHYDPKMYNECREPQAERVADKDRSNRCDQFVLARDKSPGKDFQKEKLKQAAEALFRKKGEP